MPLCIVLVSFAVFLIPGGLVRPIAKRLVLGKAAHADPDRLLLRLDFQRLFIRFQDFAHGMKLARGARPWQA